MTSHRAKVAALKSRALKGVGGSLDALETFVRLGGYIIGGKVIADDHADLQTQRPGGAGGWNVTVVDLVVNPDTCEVWTGDAWSTRRETLRLQAELRADPSRAVTQFARDLLTKPAEAGRLPTVDELRAAMIVRRIRLQNEEHHDRACELALLAVRAVQLAEQGQTHTAAEDIEESVRLYLSGPVLSAWKARTRQDAIRYYAKEWEIELPRKQELW